MASGSVARLADGAPSEMPSIEDLRARIEKELADAWSLFVAILDTEIVGLLAIKKADGVLDQLYVLPSAQRTGIGTLLLKKAMTEMPDGFTLRTASANIRGRQFYERMGLKVVSKGTHPRDGYPVHFYGWKVG